MPIENPLIETIPEPPEIRRRLTDALREVSLLRRMLKIAERAEEFRRNDCQQESTDE